MAKKIVKHEYNIHENQQVIIVPGDNNTVQSGGQQQTAAAAAAPGHLKARLFLSHRRSVSEDFAQVLHSDLTPYVEGEIFIDVLNMAAGRFAPQLEAKIKACDFFLLLIAPGTFDKINEPNDWLCWEIETALRARRLIVPILKDTALYPLKNQLPPSIQSLVAYNGVHYHLDDRAGSARSLIVRLQNARSQS